MTDSSLARKLYINNGLIVGLGIAGILSSVVHFELLSLTLIGVVGVVGGSLGVLATAVQAPDAVHHGITGLLLLGIGTIVALIDPITLHFVLAGIGIALVGVSALLQTPRRAVEYAILTVGFGTGAGAAFVDTAVLTGTALLLGAALSGWKTLETAERFEGVTEWG